MATSLAVKAERRTRQDTEATRRYRERKRTNGLCIYGGCNEPLMSSIVLCQKHRAENTAYSRQSHRRRFRACHFPGCGAGALPRRWYCMDHVVRRVRRIALGLCVLCRRVAMPGRTMCPRHAERNRAHVAASKLRSRLQLALGD